MSEVYIRPEWDNPDMREAIAKARREDPEYDRIWREGIQRMSDEIDEHMFNELKMKYLDRLRG